MLLIGAFAVAALASARHITRWIASWDHETDSPPPPDPTAEPKVWTLQEQVDSKVHWDTPEFEIRGWLEERHKVTGDRATDLLVTARKNRARAIRHKSLYGLLVSVIGMVASGRPVLLQLREGDIVLIKTAALLFAFSFCFILFCRYGIRLVTGRADGAVGY